MYYCVCCCFCSCLFGDGEHRCAVCLFRDTERRCASLHSRAVSGLCQVFALEGEAVVQELTHY